MKRYLLIGGAGTFLREVPIRNDEAFRHDRTDIPDAARESMRQPSRLLRVALRFLWLAMLLALSAGSEVLALPGPTSLSCVPHGDYDIWCDILPKQGGPGYAGTLIVRSTSPITWAPAKVMEE